MGFVWGQYPIARPQPTISPLPWAWHQMETVKKTGGYGFRVLAYPFMI
jgi:hypothetical protein